MALVAVSTGDYEKARACFEDALDLFERSATPYEAARARLELAGVLVSLDRLERARAEGELARDAFEELGASFSTGRAKALLEDIDRREAAAKGHVHGAELTQRQIEILRLVSQGRSDREIATQLEISEHTVHRHVANILLRLDAPTRAAAVAHAASLSLI
jgi:DNA-binding NarL/FixJ family response regulator